jgi:hypothetical protein
MEIPTLIRSEAPAEEPVSLLPDPTPILTLPPDEPEPEYTPEQLEYKYKKEKAQRCKIISMDILNIPLWKNTSYSSKSEKHLLLKEMERWFEKPDDEIITTFNRIVSEKMLNFEDPTNDYTKYSIYKTVIPS